MNSSGYNRKGFTLVEAMIAMVVLSVATAAVILPFSTGAALNAEGSRRTLGAKLAADLLEKIENTDYDLIYPIYDNYFEAAGSVTDVDGQVFTDPVYSRFGRFSTAPEEVPVGGELLTWATVYIYYDNIEMLRMSTLIGR